METTKGRLHRNRLGKVHRYVEQRLEEKHSPYLSQYEERRNGVVHQAPLSWEAGHENAADLGLARPMSDEDFVRVLKDREHCLDTAQARNDPWTGASLMSLSGPHNGQRRVQIGLQLASYLYDKQVQRDLSSRNLITAGGWHLLKNNERNSQHGRICSNYGEPPYDVRNIMHGRDRDIHGSHSWCVLADGTLDVDDEPDDDRLLRSEIRVAVVIAHNRIREERCAKWKMYPVTVLSISMLHVRILQVHLDLHRNAIMVRKTPYMLLEEPMDDSVKLVLKWYMGSPSGETRLEPPLDPDVEEDEPSDLEQVETTRDDGDTLERTI